MTEIDKEMSRLKSICGECVDGPWMVTYYDFETLLISTQQDAKHLALIHDEQQPRKTPESLLMAESRTAIPKLLSYIDALQQRLKAAEELAKALKRCDAALKPLRSWMITKDMIMSNREALAKWEANKS